MKRMIHIMCAAAIVATLGSVVSAVDIVTVPVGNPENLGQWSGDSYGGHGLDRICGAVDYEYNIGKFEVTAGQYSGFLNAVADTDTYGLYSTNMDTANDPLGCNIIRTGDSGSYAYTVAAEWANRPVNHVSWGDAARFANWLHNGQPTDVQGLTTTEDGAYFLNGATSDAGLLAVGRELDWQWAIPTEDEWYKAAYHKNDDATGNYFDYPTSSDSVPEFIRDGESIPGTDPGNYATYNEDRGIAGIGPPYYRTEIGEHENSESPYGTFDQGGNVLEWTETGIESYRIMRGAGFEGRDGDVDFLHASSGRFYIPSHESRVFGFRVAQVPEPTTLSLLALGGLAMVRRRKRRTCK